MVSVNNGLFTGRLFDAVGPAGPFQMIGVLTFLLIAMAVWCRVRAPGPLADRQTPVSVVAQ